MIHVFCANTRCKSKKQTISTWMRSGCFIMCVWQTNRAMESEGIFGISYSVLITSLSVGILTWIFFDKIQFFAKHFIANLSWQVFSLIPIISSLFYGRIPTNRRYIVYSYYKYFLNILLYIIISYTFFRVCVDKWFQSPFVFLIIAW